MLVPLPEKNRSYDQGCAEVKSFLFRGIGSEKSTEFRTSRVTALTELKKIAYFFSPELFSFALPNMSVP